MNLGFLASLVLVLLIFAVVVTALMFYVRHWATRQPQQSQPPQLTEGRFVKRYIPPPLRDKYDLARAGQHQRSGIQRRKIAYLMNIAIGIGALFISGGALDINSDKLLLPIDLSPQEIMALPTEAASWSLISQQNLPAMESRLAQLRQRGVAVISSQLDEGRVVNGQHLTAMAKAHWHHFFDLWELPYHRCNWDNLSTCLQGRVGIIMPGMWQLDELNQALQNGASLLLYGPPVSVLSEHQTVQWNGLTFEPYTNGSRRYLALRGDQLLTLGFDAGLTLDADRAFKGYRVISDSPQAIGISASRIAGGTIDTRIYAKKIGKGRLVWMDYAPTELDQPASIDVRDLEAITAAIFRYLLGETYSGWAMWPQGKSYAGTLSQDSEDRFHYSEKVLKLVKKHEWPITWFMLSNEAQRNRRLTQQMAEVGEVACHGDSHASFPLENLHIQTQRLARCTKVLQSITGRTASGFRPPKEEFNGETITAVANMNMSYYFADAGIDRVVPEIMREDGGLRELVSLPRMVADDYELWGRLRLNGQESMRIAENQIQWVSAVGGFLPFDFHSQYMDKNEHLAVVEYYGRRFQQPDCFFGTTWQIADWWRVRNRLVKGEPLTEGIRRLYQPVQLRVDEQGKLLREET